MAYIVFGIIGAAVGIGGLIFSFTTFARNQKKDNATEGKQDGIMLTEIGYIKAGVDDMKRDIREFRNEMQTQHDKIIRVEESCKQAHKRIDKLEKFHQPN